MRKVHVVSINGGSPLVFSTATKAVTYVQIDFGDFLFDEWTRLDDVETKDLVEILNRESTLKVLDCEDFEVAAIDICEIQ